MKTMDLEDFMAAFPWESKDQKVGFQSLLKFVRTLPPELDLPWAVLACWNAQKSKETTEWLISVMGDQVSALQNEIVKLREELHEVRSGVLR